MTNPSPNASASSSSMVDRFPELKGLMDGNKQWAKKTTGEMPELLPKLATGQTPKILWIGCVDSRVPETLITSCRPGDIFVHRNIANQFQRDDPSANAVLEYALGVVGCTHVIIVGHTGCGGAIASFAQPRPTENAQPPDSHLMQFLDPLIRFRHTLEEGCDVNDLIRENVKDGIKNLVDSPAVKTAWDAGKEIWLHGWMFDIEHGLLHDLECSVGPNSTNANVSAGAGGNGTKA